MKTFQEFARNLAPSTRMKASPRIQAPAIRTVEPEKIVAELKRIIADLSIVCNDIRNTLSSR